MADPAIAGSGVLARFLAFVVLLVACGVATVYAALSERAGTLSVGIWRYVVIAMGAGMAYAVAGGYELLGVATVAGTAVTAIRQVLQLFFIILLSLSMRELYYRLPYRDPGSTAIPHGRARLLEAAFMGIAFVEFVVVIAIGLTTAVRAVQAVASVAFAAYGVSFAAGTRAEAMAGGTVVDGLLVRFISVLTCLGAAGVLEGTTLLGVPPALAAGATTVFIVMSATFLLALGVRLKANVDAVSGGS
ncbi:uncharacterized protein Nmlp_1130 [Natronomonas moolapensis 8.8.11]|uniref:Uncharacterized protein n=1 Tax=Natronomonas moolapensis (strain DSM 18674 / CECT 7526 / JCM 14361 / 8.8.11) TaxID=268739 RepID=M1XN65_NATM8|nr:hypothetical protein [Natronomonas moolapensis]CCQ35340.1 uncharacterized protein Nmlp_1130 [Natronomonas moolapensis 8.8.11]